MNQEQLEAKVKSFYPVENIGLNLADLTDDQLYALLALAMWKDGCPWDIVENVAMGRNPLYKDRSDCIHFLMNTFAY